MNCSIKEVQEDRVKTAQGAAKRWNAHVILKGAHTIIAAPDGRTFVNTTGNAGLAKGGSGDVLTGILAGLTGQFWDWGLVAGVGAGRLFAWGCGGFGGGGKRSFGIVGDGKWLRRCLGRGKGFAGVAAAWVRK